MIIPLPLSIIYGQGRWACPSPLAIQWSRSPEREAAVVLSRCFRDRFSTDAVLVPAGGSAQQGGLVTLCLQEKVPRLAGLPGSLEGYVLDVASDRGTTITALTLRGLLHGLQSLLQLVEGSDHDGWHVPVVQVVDAPRFPWRGVLLDVGRHFFSARFIKRMLDVMAMFKMNKFHWHLTEDQGWRLEIKGWPLLTEKGAWREAKGGGTYGGFYSQEQVRDIVAYASARGIDVLPEIELPGHCGAALACYPQLSCAPGAVTHVPAHWGIHEDVYCAGNEEVFAFLEAVLDEVVGMFPFEYVHIGGDECPKVRWQGCAKCQQRMQQEGLSSEGELQSWFIRRISRFLSTRQRRIIGWDEILEGGLAEGATVMSWRGTAGGVLAAKSGHDVIMTPTTHCYFDYRQAPSVAEPGAWYACLPLATVYAFDPIPQPQGNQAPSEAAGAGTGGAAASAADGVVRSDAAPAAGAPAAPAQSQSAVLLPDGAPGARSDKVALPPVGCGSPMAVEEGDSASVQPAGDEPTPSSGQGSPGGSPPPTGPPESPVRLADRTLSPPEAARILGSQANLWTEYVGDEDTAEYMLLPRLCAMAEALWSPADARDWDGFVPRVQRAMAQLGGMGYHTRRVEG